MFNLNKRLTTIGIRAAQVVLSIVCLGLSASIANEYSGFVVNFVNLRIATSVLSLIWIGLTWFLNLRSLHQVFARPGVLALSEFIFMVLWLASFATMAEHYGSGGCYSYGYYTTYRVSGCKTGKGALAMGLLNWLLFLALFILVIIYQVVPVSKADQFGANFERTYDVQYGGLFLDTEPVGGSTYPPAADPTVVQDSPNEDLTDKDEVLPNQITSQPINSPLVTSDPVYPTDDTHRNV